MGETSTRFMDYDLQMLSAILQCNIVLILSFQLVSYVSTLMLDVVAVKCDVCGAIDAQNQTSNHCASVYCECEALKIRMGIANFFPFFLFIFILYGIFVIYSEFSVPYVHSYF